MANERGSLIEVKANVPSTVHLSGLWFEDGLAEEHWFLAFEAYGHAMACASALEMQLTLMITKGVTLGLCKGKNQRSETEMTAFVEGVRLQTFPNLISTLKRNFDLSSSLSDALDIAKKSRDFLAHNFWQVHLGNLRDRDGIELIARECALNCWHFLEVSRLLAHELGIDVTDFVRMSAASAAAKHDEWRIFMDKWIDT